MRPSFFHHLHPPTIPYAQSRLRYTLGAGGLSVYLVLVIVLTGILEMFYYVPTPEKAAQTVQMITFLVPFGAIIRNMHYWAAQLLVVAAMIHMLRVILTGAFAPPRRFNYLLGLLLFVMILFLDFTGYVLRWDEGVRWALVAGTNLIKSVPGIGPMLYSLLMGGAQPTSATLIRFYSWHIFGLMLVLFGLGVWHIFRVRRDGGIAVPPPEIRQDPRRISRFELVRREGLGALIATIVLLLLATFAPAPLATAMSASTSLAGTTPDARAPWFFLWVQQLLKLGNPFWMGVMLPLGVITFLALLPYIFPPTPPEELGRWFPKSGRIMQLIVLLVVLALAILTLLAERPG